jgi:hypothetical protein
MPRRHVVSWHILRRRARAQRKRLERAQVVALRPAAGDERLRVVALRPAAGDERLRAENLLKRYGVEPGDKLSVPRHRVRGKFVVEAS